MNIRKIVISTALLFSSSVFAGENIGHGTIKGIKVGNDDQETLVIHLNSGFTLDARNCNGRVTIRTEDVSSVRMSQMSSVLLAAYMAGKKVRFHSHLTSGCYATFVALQETYF